MEYTTQVLGISFTVCADAALFSPRGLDEGTRALLENTVIVPGNKVLDLGCGNGPVGIYCALRGADVWMSDINPVALEAARNGLLRNGVGAELISSDAFDGIDAAGFDVILSNPPYHADYCVAKRFIEKGFNRLKVGGMMALVVKRPLWYENKLRTVFGGVKTIQAGEYTVLIAQRRTLHYAKSR